MGVSTDLDEGNISTSIEELSEEERQKYLVVREHFKAQFLKGFKKDEKGHVTRVQEFMMPSFTLKNKQVEVISNVRTSSSDLFSQLSSVVDQKIADIYKPTNDLLSDLKGQLDIMKKGKSVDDNCVFQTPCLSTVLASSKQPQYSMPMDYFVGQTPPPSSFHTGPVKPVHVTGQTGQTSQMTDSTDALVVSLPIVSIPCLAASRINELTNSVPPLPSHESGFLHEPISNNVHKKSFGACTNRFISDDGTR